MPVTERTTKALKFVVASVEMLRLVTKKKLMFVGINLNGKQTCVTVGMGTIHNFFSKLDANRLGLLVGENLSQVKVVSSNTTPMSREIKDVIKMDDYQVTLGIYFMQKAKKVLISFLNS